MSIVSDVTDPELQELNKMTREVESCADQALEYRFLSYTVSGAPIPQNLQKWKTERSALTEKGLVPTFYIGSRVEDGQDYNAMSEKLSTQADCLVQKLNAFVKKLRPSQEVTAGSAVTETQKGEQETTG